MRSVMIVLAVIAVCVATAEWDMNQAIEAIHWAKITYCTDSHITRWTCDACPKFPGVTHSKGYFDDALHDSSGYVAYYPAKDQIIYAFRGTINLPGWIEDLDEFQTPYPACNKSSNCMVHRGLLWGYNQIKAGLWDHLQNLVEMKPSATILVTGHSMGAAQSAFAFLDIVMNLKGHTGKKMLYNFGCPRVGNMAFVKFMEDVVEPHGEHYRHTNFGDPIVHLPPLFFDNIPVLGKWLHSPREVYFLNPFANPRSHPPKICAGTVTSEDHTCAYSTPWYDMIGIRNHTTYLGHGLGCFLEGAKGIKPENNQIMSPKTVKKLSTLLKSQIEK